MKQFTPKPRLTPSAHTPPPSVVPHHHPMIPAPKISRDLEIKKIQTKQVFLRTIQRRKWKERVLCTQRVFFLFW